MSQSEEMSILSPHLLVVLSCLIALNVACESDSNTLPCTMCAEITVNPLHVTGEINTAIHGHFIENLADCIYGGIWDEFPVVPVVHGRMRLDVLDKIERLEPPVIRWPRSSSRAGACPGLDPGQP